MQTFVGCEMHNKIDPFFSLCIVGKGANEWKWTCQEYGLHEHKLEILMKMHFTSKVTTLQQFLAHQTAIIMCYSHEIEALAYKIPWAQIWAIAKAIYDAFFPIMITWVVNKWCEYWLWWSNVFAFAIKLYVKLSKEKLELQA
jgi:hypothetical protein